MDELRRKLSVEAVGYRAFDFVRAFLLAEPGAAALEVPSFIGRLEAWAADADGESPQQMLASADQEVLIGRVRAAL